MFYKLVRTVQMQLLKKLIIPLFFYAAMKDRFESCEAGHKNTHFIE